MASTSSSSATSDQTLESLKNETATCDLCFEVYKVPKLLSCQHTFCEHCLEEWVESNKGNLNCPNCRKELHLPPEGVKGLPTNRMMTTLVDFIKTKTPLPCTSQTALPDTGLKCATCPSKNADQRCVECALYMCLQCSTVHKRTLTKAHRILTIKEFEQERRTNPTINQPSIHCEKHTDKTRDVYCKTCKMCVCLNCALAEHPNPEHQYSSIEGAAQEAKGRLKGLITDKSRKMTDAKSAINIELRELEKHFKKGMADINNHAKAMVKNVRKMQQKARDNFQDSFSKKETILKSQIENLKLRECRLSENQEFAEMKIEFANPVPFLMVQDTMKESIENNLGNFNTNPEETRYLYFDITGSADVGELGHVRTVPFSFASTSALDHSADQGSSDQSPNKKSKKKKKKGETNPDIVEQMPQGDGVGQTPQQEKTKKRARAKEDKGNKGKRRKKDKEMEPAPDSSESQQKASSSDPPTEADIKCMGVKQLKEILTTNYVDIRGMIEKQDLVEKVIQLYKEKYQSHR